MNIFARIIKWWQKDGEPNFDVDTSCKRQEIDSILASIEDQYYSSLSLIKTPVYKVVRIKKNHVWYDDFMRGKFDGELFHAYHIRAKNGPWCTVDLQPINDQSKFYLREITVIGAMLKEVKDA